MKVFNRSTHRKRWLSSGSAGTKTTVRSPIWTAPVVSRHFWYRCWPRCVRGEQCRIPLRYATSSMSRMKTSRSIPD
ncbi:Uncharacterised protein [Mycobacteroides abscessus subsp. abscessus]|nr:Uncharacterised protein [Mycobacteroides abscessus subsp. abscessus]